MSVYTREEYIPVKTITVCAGHCRVVKGCFLCLLQILYYSNDVFKAAGIPHPDIATVVTVGVVLVLVTLVVVSERGREGRLGGVARKVGLYSQFCI